MIKGRTMCSHHSARMKTDVWLTPPEIIKSLGVFDLDPCAADNMPWKTATKEYTKKDDGLSREWRGRVWLNPPYSKEARLWISKLAGHGDGIALIFARTDTDWFHNSVFSSANAILFIKGRLHFYSSDGIRAKFNAGAPSCLVAFGEKNVTLLRDSGISGKLLIINP